jgi:hypothetical protein
MVLPRLTISYVDDPREDIAYSSAKENSAHRILKLIDVVRQEEKWVDDKTYRGPNGNTSLAPEVVDVLHQHGSLRTRLSPTLRNSVSYWHFTK